MKFGVSNHGIEHFTFIQPTPGTNNQVAWIADVPGSKDKYLAVFNTSPPPPPSNGRRRGPPAGASTNSAVAPVVAPATNNPAAKLPVSISVSLADIGIGGAVKVRDLWTHKELGEFTGEFAPVINSHGAGLYRVSPAK